MSDSVPTGGAPNASGSAPPGLPKGRFEVRATADSHFSWLRTRLSVEQSLMSWVRTAVSLIGFGFAIVQFFERMEHMPGVIPARVPEAPRYLGLALILCGVLGLLISLWEYNWTLRYLWSETYAPIAGMTAERRQTPIVAIAILLVFIGLFAFVSVLFRFV